MDFLLHGECPQNMCQWSCMGEGRSSSERGLENNLPRSHLQTTTESDDDYCLLLFPREVNILQYFILHVFFWKTHKRCMNMHKSLIWFYLQEFAVAQAHLWHLTRHSAAGRSQVLTWLKGSPNILFWKTLDFVPTRRGFDQIPTFYNQKIALKSINLRGSPIPTFFGILVLPLKAEHLEKKNGLPGSFYMEVFAQREGRVMSGQRRE